MLSRNRVRTRIPIAGCFIAFLCVFNAAGSASSQSFRKSGDTDRATLVILAPAGPVLVDLRLTVSRMPYREWVAQFLVREMDVDKSGRLDESELSLLTESVKTLINVNDTAQILTAMQVGTTDVAVDDFVAWLRNRIPRAFDLIAQPQAADDAVRLASLLDIDYDGAISVDELKMSSRTLRYRDLDNDETFSVSELLPYRDPRSQNAAVAPDAVSLPFFHVVDHASAQRASARILQQYGIDGHVLERLLRQPVGNEKTDAFDQVLSEVEVQAVIEDPVFHIVMDVSLSVKANTSRITVSVNPNASAFCVLTDEQSFGAFHVAIDGMPLKVIALGGSANDRRSTQGYIGQSFVMSDGDRNQYLNESEFSGMLEAFNRSGASADFSSVDTNDDKMVTRAEVFSFVKRDQMAAASHVEVSVKQDGKTLFGILDGNSDRRLSRRELIAGSDALKLFDLNQDNKFADTELGTEYVLTISLGRPEFRRTSGQSEMMAIQPGSGDAILPRTESLTGPEWFHRMDRNLDGDISLREFLGTRRDFLAIDSNNDNLISAEEALLIEELR